MSTARGPELMAPSFLQWKKNQRVSQSDGGEKKIKTKTHHSGSPLK